MRKVKIVIMSVAEVPGQKPAYRRTEVWSGDMDILDQSEYIAKISFIAEGEPQPLCDIPFATGIGHYVWIPGEVIDGGPEDETYAYLS